MMEITISIIGFGNIGKYICGLLLTNKDARFHINVIDIDWKVYGAILDMQHAAELYERHNISYNSDELLASSDYIFHCAGASVPKGKSRLVTCQSSIEITEAVFRNFNPKKEPFIIVVANPVEIISFVTQRLTDLPSSRVIGTGTYLDSVRMNHVIKTTDTAISAVDAILLGEHGTTAFLSEQLSTVDGAPFSNYFSHDSIDELMNTVKAAAEEIKQTQSATIYGVSFCAVELFNALLRADNSKYAVSTALTDDLKEVVGSTPIFLSLFSEIGDHGAIPVSTYIPNDQERQLLQKSIDLITPSIPLKYL
jgi:L-lactate dehydrogenase